jgi:hypothetical protein
MTDRATSPLRRRMIEDMTIRQFAASTQHTYVRFVQGVLDVLAEGFLYLVDGVGSFRPDHRARVGGREHSGIRRRSGARSPFLGNRPAAMSSPRSLRCRAPRGCSMTPSCKAAIRLQYVAPEWAPPMCQSTTISFTIHVVSVLRCPSRTAKRNLAGLREINAFAGQLR